jgi:hypothetical protein
MEREEALVLLMGAHTKALAVIMAATLSTLVKEGVLTEEAVLKGLRTTASDARSKLASEDDLHPDRLIADSIDVFVALIEGRLLSK